MAKRTDDVAETTQETAPSEVVTASAPVLSPTLAMSFGADDDGKKYHAAQAQKHMEMLGFKTQLEPTRLSVWLELAR